MKVEPIEPSKAVESINNAIEKLVSWIQGFTEPLVVISLGAVGLVILVGLIFAVIGLTKRILQIGVYLLIGTAVMYLFVNQPTEIVGVIKGTIGEIFGGGSS